MTDPIASLRALHERWRAYFGAPGEPMVTDADYERTRTRLVADVIANLPTLLDAAELLRSLRQDYANAQHRYTLAEIDAVLSRLHVEDTP